VGQPSILDATGRWVHGPAVADPAGGAITDTQARTATASILAALRARGILAGSTSLPSATQQFDGVHTALLPAITAPSGGTPDPELRTGITGILAALKAAGVVAGRTVPASLTAMSLGSGGSEASAPAVVDVSGGANIDANCRTAIASAITAMRSASLIAS
jgi:predicted deacylase